jgi:nitroreductase
MIAKNNTINILIILKSCFLSSDAMFLVEFIFSYSVIMKTMSQIANQAFKDQFYQVIQSRQSIRKFKKQSIERELLEKIISQAGFHAPSGKNNQNWKFFVVTGNKRDEYLKYSQKSWLGIKDQLKNKLKPSLYDFTERFFFTLGDAPAIIFAYSVNDPNERHYTSIGSVYMAVQNINLACQVEGLGCCTMGAPLEIADEIHEFLDLKNDDDFKLGRLELLCAVVLGYPDHEPPKAARKTENRIVYK